MESEVTICCWLLLRRYLTPRASRPSALRPRAVITVAIAFSGRDRRMVRGMHSKERDAGSSKSELFGRTKETFPFLLSLLLLYPCYHLLLSPLCQTKRTKNGCALISHETRPGCGKDDKKARHFVLFSFFLFFHLHPSH